jgi:hypothetical protein
MTKNMSNADRAIRVVISVVICFSYITNAIYGTEGSLLLALAVYLAFNSLTGVCPIYSLLGISTNKQEMQED